MKKIEFDILDKVLEILDLYTDDENIVCESGGIHYIFQNKEQLKKIKFQSDYDDILYLKDDEIFFNPLRNNKLAKFILDDFMDKNDIDEFSFYTDDSDKNNINFSGKFIKNGKTIYELSNIAPLNALMVAMIIGYSEYGDEDYDDIKKKIEKVGYGNGTNRGSEKGSKKRKSMV